MRRRRGAARLRRWSSTRPTRAGYPWNVVKSPAGESYAIVLPPDAPQPVLLQGWIQRAVAAALAEARGLRLTTR